LSADLLNKLKEMKKHLTFILLLSNWQSVLDATIVLPNNYGIQTHVTSGNEFVFSDASTAFL
jgi:hypothetical protein